ncbi:sporulation protein YtfJ [Paenibacillus sambharensis]|uniref:Sporulation protein YtfJ n=1 Tax=Paenibacillus sambharensis TaxID=1803190 RepID=A0A2W1L438_9BACL|nr:sporulation protein YtfJ [Paenibacillus sambharensis]
MEHPIQGLMETAMENIKAMVDVNTIVGDPVQTPDGSIIMPISKVGFGFVAGGSDYRVDSVTETSTANTTIEHHNPSVAMPFGGGSGGGVSITPIAFLVVGSQGVKIVSLDNSTHLWEKVMDSAPKVFDKLQNMMKGGGGSMGMGAMGSTGMGAAGMGSAMSSMTSGMGMGSTMGGSSMGSSTSGSTGSSNTSDSSNQSSDDDNSLI